MNDFANKVWRAGMRQTNPQDTEWVFLRGLARESAHWDDFPKHFARAIPNAIVHPLDLPGNGKLWKEPSPTRLSKTLERLRSDLAEARGDSAQPVYLFALSLGAMLAIEWGQRYPEEVAGMVLVNTSLRGTSPVHRRLAWKSWGLLGRIAMTRNLAQRERLIMRLTSSAGEHDHDLINARVQTARRHPILGMNFLRQIWAAARYCSPPKCPSVPLLLLNSLGDRMVDPSCSDAIATLWQVEKKTHPWAGHDIPLDDSEWTIDAVKSWLEARANQAVDFYGASGSKDAG